MLPNTLVEKKKHELQFHLISLCCVILKMTLRFEIIFTGIRVDIPVHPVRWNMTSFEAKAISIRL